MRIDPASSTPIFRQIAAAIRGAIAAGVYRPGDTIPSIRASALDLLVNPNTVARAYAELEREGLITPERGLGMVVARRTEDAARATTLSEIQGGFEAGVRMGRRAGLDRAGIDGAYEKAWAEAGDEAPSIKPETVA